MKRKRENNETKNEPIKKKQKIIKKECCGVSECTEHTVYCESCKKELCSSFCKNFCENCSKLICKDCIYHCENCRGDKYNKNDNGEWVEGSGICLLCVKKCDNCKERLCDEHLFKCSECEKMVCRGQKKDKLLQFHRYKCHCEQCFEQCLVECRCCGKILCKTCNKKSE